MKMSALSGTLKLSHGRPNLPAATRCCAKPVAVLRGLLAIFCTIVLCAGAPVAAQAQTVRLGSAGYALAPKGGDPVGPAAPHRIAALLKTPAQTNQWYSSLLFSAQPEVIYAQPLTIKPALAGFEVALPRREVVPTERKDVDIEYPHRHPLIVSALDFTPGRAKLSAVSDWSIEIAMANGADALRLAVAHGSPYAQFQISRGDFSVVLPAAGQRLAHSDSRVLLVRAQGQTYALFGPTGVRWEPLSPTQWAARVPPGRGYLAATVLPDEDPSTLALLAKHAYAFLTGTRVDWRVDAVSGAVDTEFTAQTRMMEGPEQAPLLGLYPHHWFENPTVAQSLGPAFDTVRGKIRLLAASSFQTRARYQGFVPWWPAVAGSERTDELRSLMKADLRNARRMMLEIGNGPYWQGKGLQRIAKLMDVFEAQGDLEGREQLSKLLLGRIDSWFSGESRKTYFHLDQAIGSVLGHPEEYFSIEQMNDHHFHYGYWIRTVAELALRDPALASKERWGGMVDLLIADIASTKRDGGQFPFLRHFDSYEGHSWASGIGLGPWGNNQESSSEAVNAWVGLILWAEVTGDTALRDLGIWLYSSEIKSIRHYWFDQHRLVFPPEYPHVETSMLFGGKYAHNTWWTDEPRQIKGINLLPITTASAYLGIDPAYVKRNLGTLKRDTEIFQSRAKKADPPDMWQDLFAKYLALADPALALKEWDRWGAVELGDTRTHTLHWMLSLQEMGTPDASVTADTPLYAVFRRPDGRRTYLAYNAGRDAKVVKFSDGKVLQVAPRSLAKAI
jgi:endoglucanase Acf2